MRIPRWARTVVLAAVLGVLGWGAVDYVNVRDRVTKLFVWVEQVDKRLESIDKKLTEVLRRL